MYIHVILLAYVLTDTLNWQVIWGKEKYLLNGLYEKLKNKVSVKTYVNSKESVSSNMEI